MIRIVQFCAYSVSVLVLGIPQAFADVEEFDLMKVRLYEQTSTSPPATPSAYFFNSYISSFPGDATLATVNGSPMIEFYPREWDFAAEFVSQAAMDAAYPKGITYNLQLQGGILGTRIESLQLNTPEMYPTPAALTPASFNAIQNVDPNQDLLIEWNLPDENTALVFFGLFTTTSDIGLIETYLPPSQTSMFIPAGTMASAQAYELEIGFLNGSMFNGQPSPGFGETAQGLSGLGSLTVLSFNSVISTCTTDINGDGTVDVVDLLEVISVWGSCPKGCAADINGDNVVDVIDLLAVIGTWGGCIP